MRVFLYLLVLFIPFGLKAQYSYDNVFEKKLDNGLTCLVIENPNMPLVTIELVVKEGSAYEPEAENGLAFLNQFFFFSANKDYPSNESFKKKIDQLGAVTGHSIDEEASSFYITLTKRNLDNGLKLMNSATRFPLYMEEDLQAAQKNAVEQMQGNQASPDYLISADMDKQLWGANANRKNIMGNIQVISSVSPAKLIEHHKLFYTPENCLIIISGDVSRSEVFQKVQGIFGSWEKGTTYPTDVYPMPAQKPLSYSARFVTQTQQAPTPLLLYSFSGPDLRNSARSTYVAKVWAAMLSSGSAPITQSLLNSGLAQQLNADYKASRFNNSVNISIIPSPEKLKECLAQMNKEINSFNQYSYYSDDLLKRAKRQIKNEFAFANEKTTSLSHAIGSAWARAGTGYFKDYIANVDAVTMDDIINFVNQYIHGKPIVTGLMISQAQRLGLHTDTYFSPTYSINEYQFSFTRNSNELFDITNKNLLASLVQFLQINPELRIDLIASQDADEKKETARERFLAIYKQMEAGGVSEKQLDAMKVSIYIRHGNNEEEIKKNMTVNFTIQN